MDELEFATNWKRAYVKLYREIKWLNAYAIINEIASQKILKKYKKVYFEMKDNIIDKNLQVMLSEFHFCKRNQFKQLQKEFNKVIARFFTINNSLREAQIILNGDSNLMNRRDLCIISFFGGAIIFTLIVLIVFISLHPESFNNDNTKLWTAVQHTNPIMRFCLMLCYILFATGFAISVFREYQINYLHIF